LGGSGSENKNKGRAKLMKEFLILSTFLFNTYFMISNPTAPTIMAVVVASAGMILPAINLT
jgi:hypothetical protein